MSSKQRKKLILAIILGVVVVGAIFAFLFLFEGMPSTTVDLDTVKATGNYEQLKKDIVKTLRTKDSAAAQIANDLFEDIGVMSYESMSRGGKRGNVTIVCDGYNLDANIVGGKMSTIYIGNVIVYKNKNTAVSVIPNSAEYTYTQYKNIVMSFIKATKLSEQVGKDIYEHLSTIGITSFLGVKAGELVGQKGYFGTDTTVPLFLVLAGDKVDKIYVDCDGFDPFVVYDSSDLKHFGSVADCKVLQGARMGIANVLKMRVKEAVPTFADVIFPAALLSGDDSWLMVRHDGKVYIEVRAEVVQQSKKKDEEGAKKSQDFFVTLQDGENDLLSLKIGRKTYI